MATQKQQTTEQSQQTNPWQELAREQVERMGELLGEVERVQGQAVEQAHAAVDEAARLTNVSVDYAAKLSAQWRGMARDAARQATQWMAR